MPVEREQNAGVATLTLNRPETLNAMSPGMLDDFERLLDEIEHDSEVGCVVVTGAGEKAFCAGADIGEMKEMTPVEARAYAQRGQALTRRLERSETPVIAAVNGVALGGGCEIALACDFRVAADSAVFGQPEVRLGVLPGWGGTQRLMRVMSPGLAMEMILTGQPMKADAAKEAGLVNHVYALEDLRERTQEIAVAIASGPTWAISAAKRLCNLSLEADLEAGLQHEADAFGLAFTTDDQQEGMSAFLEKRPADFTRE